MSLAKYIAKLGATRPYGKGERILEDITGMLGKGAGYAKGAAEHVVKKHPMATGAALGVGGTLAAEHALDDDDEDDHLLHKMGLGR